MGSRRHFSALLVLGTLGLPPLLAQTPSITSLNPNSVPSSAGAATVTVSGSGFRNSVICVLACGSQCPLGSVVKVDGTNVTTTFVSSTQLRANIPADLLTTPRNAQIRVHNDTGVSCQANVAGPSSNAATLAVFTDLTVTPSVVDVSSQAGEVSGGNESSEVINTGPGVTVTASSNAPWLTISLVPNGAPAGTFRVTDMRNASANGSLTLFLKADTRLIQARRDPYPVTITVSAPGRPTRTLTANISVSGIAIGLSQTMISMSAPVGGTATATFFATNLFSAANVQVTVSQPTVPWLTVSSRTPTVGQVVTLTARPGNMEAGQYNTSLVVTAPNPSVPQTLAVSLTLRSPPVLTAAPPAVTLIAAAGATTATGQLQVRTSSDAVPFAVVSSQFWLTVQPTTATATTTLNLTADLPRVPPGSPTATLTISPPQGSGVQPISITVTVQLRPIPALTASPPSLSLTPAAGAATVNGQLQIVTDGDPVPFTVASTAPWLTVTPVSAQATTTLNATADLARLGSASGSASITVTPSLTGVRPLSIAVSVSSAPPSRPAISSNGVVNGASFTGDIAAGAWITIQGQNFTTVSNCDPLANPRAGCRSWAQADFVNGTPTALDGVSVSIGGRPAFVAFISPVQINVQAPDVGPGQVQVTVTNANGTSNAVTATIDRFAPAFFPYGRYAVATHLDGRLVAPASSCSNCTPAARGETIILWGTGFGPTTPAVPAGILPGQAVTSGTANAPTPVITIGNVAALVNSAALSPQSYGLCQIAITIPSAAASGDQLIVATTGGRSSRASGVFLAVQ